MHTVCINLPVFFLSKTPRLLENLGFVPLGKDLLGQTLLSDGEVMIRLDAESEYGAGILYFSENMPSMPLGQMASDEAEADWAREWKSPEGVSLSMLYATADTVPDYSPAGELPYGKFYEVSLMTTDFSDSLVWWMKAGFELTYGDPETGSFVTLSDGKIRVGLYKPGSCPHIFNNPAVTYFDPSMKEKIAKAREAGILFAQEIPDKTGEVVDAIIETEEGWHIFLFTA
ncbi:MAG: hypothetical protein R3C61_25955 [Bacteroidia bacterium]